MSSCLPRAGRAVTVTCTHGTIAVALVLPQEAIAAGADNYDFELRHKAILDRFGRYPHRDSVLGRVPADEEIEFLKQPGSRF
jgi:uncharacterized protein (DUF924 family)